MELGLGTGIGIGIGQSLSMRIILSDGNQRVRETDLHVAFYLKFRIGLVTDSRSGTPTYNFFYFYFRKASESDWLHHQDITNRSFRLHGQ